MSECSGWKSKPEKELVVLKWLKYPVPPLRHQQQPIHLHPLLLGLSSVKLAEWDPGTRACYLGTADEFQLFGHLGFMQKIFNTFFLSPKGWGHRMQNPSSLGFSIQTDGHGTDLIHASSVWKEELQQQPWWRKRQLLLTGSGGPK